MSDSIRERNLGHVTPSPTDEVRMLRGGKSVRASVAEMPVPLAAQQQIDALRAVAGLTAVPYKTVSSLPGSDPGAGNRVALVWKDSDPANNGVYVWDTTKTPAPGWDKSNDLTSQLASRMSAIDEGLEHEELPDDSGSVYAVADAAGRPSFVDVDISGNPTPQATGRILNSLRRSSGFANIAALGDGLIQNEVSTPDTGIGFAITGEDGSQTDLEVDGNGKFTARVLKGIADRVKAEIGAPVDIDNPAPYILIVGDSLSAGATASNDASRWRNRLSVLTGIEHRNMAVGGETARTIISRVGCMSFLATVDGGEIPESGAVEVTLTGYDGGVVNPFIQGNETSWAINPCSIAGVAGTLSESSGNYVFTRSVAGDAVVVGEIPQRVVTYAYNNHRRGITIWWLGQNGGYTDLNNLLAMVKSGVAWQTDSRFLVMTPPTSTAAARAEVEALFRDAFGDKYVNIRAYMSSYWALNLAGITPTATDESDIAVGRVPESLRGDSVHHNDAGQLVIATVLYQRGKELGYWE